ncbi:MAG TPA: hypothetical protein VG028_09120 [Terriglobia bacterium]|nr:hypothetical protein [Terriglobia bacterium]
MLGGTGRTHNWKISAQNRAGVDVLIFLAGGLTRDNVQDAIRQVGPWALDVCSGVRARGKLDELKISRFFAAVSAA